MRVTVGGPPSMTGLALTLADAVGRALERLSEGDWPAGNASPPSSGRGPRLVQRSSTAGKTRRTAPARPCQLSSFLHPLAGPRRR
jgi:hypothetical protein